MHEHDGSGCLDCKCQASPMNAWPCTCPSGKRMGHRTIFVNGRPIEQTILYHSQFEMGRLGEMTRVQEDNGYTFHIQIDEQYQDLLGEYDFYLSAHPKPMFRSAGTKAVLEDHIILGEN